MQRHSRQAPFESDADTRWTQQTEKDFKRLGCAQIVLGVVVIGLNIVASVLWDDIISQAGPGYWSGATYIAIGAIGVHLPHVSKKNRQNHLNVFLLLSALSALVTLGLVVITAIGLDQTSHGAYDDQFQFPKQMVCSTLVCCSLIGACGTFLSCVLAWEHMPREPIIHAESPNNRPTGTHTGAVRSSQRPTVIQMTGNASNSQPMCYQSGGVAPMSPVQIGAEQYVLVPVNPGRVQNFGYATTSYAGADGGLPTSEPPPYTEREEVVHPNPTAPDFYSSSKP